MKWAIIVILAPKTVDMYAQLGNIVFEGMKGFTSFEASRSSIIAEHARIGGKPKLQKTGDAADTINFTMRLHHAFCTPEDELRKIDQAVRTAEINPLLLGNGSFVGTFVIKSAQTTWQQTDTRGNIHEAMVQVDLVEYHTDLSAGALASQAVGMAFANSSNSPIKSIPARLQPSTIDLNSASLQRAPISDAHAVGLGVSKSAAIGNGIDNNVASLGNNLGVAKTTLNKVLRQCDEMKQLLNSIARLIDKDPNSEVYNRTRALAGRIPTTIGVIDTLRNRVNSMVSAIDSGNGSQVVTSLTAVVNSANDLKNQVNGIKRDATDVVSLTAGGR